MTGATLDIVIAAPTLDALAQRINAATQAAEASACAAVAHAIEAGRLLIEAKGQVAHGQWEPWLQQHCAVAPRTARAYMQLCNKVPTLPEQERQRVADLPLRKAMSAICTTPAGPARYKPTKADFSVDRPILDTAHTSLRKLARDVGLRPIRRERIVSLQKKLREAQSILDRMAGEAS